MSAERYTNVGAALTREHFTHYCCKPLFQELIQEAKTDKNQQDIEALFRRIMRHIYRSEVFEMPFVLGSYVRVVGPIPQADDSDSYIDTGEFYLGEVVSFIQDGALVRITITDAPEMGEDEHYFEMNNIFPSWAYDLFVGDVCGV